MASSGKREMNVLGKSVAAYGAAALVFGALCACGSGTSGPTCDDYAKHGVVARNIMVADAMRLHGVNVVDIRLHEKIDKVIAEHCGERLDPKGDVKATRNNSESFDATVDWAELRSASIEPGPPSTPHGQ